MSADDNKTEMAHTHDHLLLGLNILTDNKKKTYFKNSKSFANANLTDSALLHVLKPENLTVSDRTRNRIEMPVKSFVKGTLPVSCRVSFRFIENSFRINENHIGLLVKVVTTRV